MVIAGVAVCVALLTRLRVVHGAHRRRIDETRPRIPVDGNRAESTVAGAPTAETAMSFGRTEYERWARHHRDAVDAAERWLTSELKQSFEPLDAPASSLSVEADKTRSERTTERLRGAALNALSQARPSPQPAVSLPVRHRRVGRGGEFDHLATGIAATVRRPEPLPRRRPRLSATSEDDNLPPDRPGSADRHATAPQPARQPDPLFRADTRRPMAPKSCN